MLKHHPTRSCERGRCCIALLLSLSLFAVLFHRDILATSLFPTPTSSSLWRLRGPCIVSTSQSAQGVMSFCSVSASCTRLWYSPRRWPRWETRVCAFVGTMDLTLLLVLQYANPLLDELDIHGVISSRLFREACVLYQGKYVKDLALMGRDLRRTIIVDNSPCSYLFHPENAIGCERCVPACCSVRCVCSG